MAVPDAADNMETLRAAVKRLSVAFNPRNPLRRPDVDGYLSDIFGQIQSHLAQSNVYTQLSTEIIEIGKASQHGNLQMVCQTRCQAQTLLGQSLDGTTTANVPIALNPPRHKSPGCLSPSKRCSIRTSS